MTAAIDWDRLLEVAHEARAHAHAPYSRYPVGAAVLTEDGAVYGGCNVENRSFGLTLCAERAAIAAAVTAGAGKPVAVAVLTASQPPAPPCGLCRETLAEFAGGDLPIVLANDAGERRQVRLGELFPEPFVFPPPEEDPPG